MELNMADDEVKNGNAGQNDYSVAWHALHADEVLKKLQTPLETGLSGAEAAERLAKFGPNQLAEKPRPSFFRLVLDQLNSFVVILLVAAAAISAALGEWVDSSAILAIVVLNAILGVVQEKRAEEALAALKKLAAPEAQVLRDGRRISLPAAELVPGDVVFLEAGNYIPADVRLLEAVNLRVEEAALTGESVAVQKNAALALDKDIPLGDRKNTAFMGTVVSYGRGKGVVVSTGMHTQLGLIATMLQAVEEEETPLQRRLNELGKTLGWACLVVCALVFGVGLLRGEGSPLDLFMIAVSLAIAAVPEGLPAIVTISLALGMREMIHRHALIRRLSSVETLGSATVICSDKTGTLTQNEMTVTRVWVDGHSFDISGQGYAPQGEFTLDGKKIQPSDYPALGTALWVGTLNNDAQIEKVENGDAMPTYRIVGDPTEGSILVAAAKAGAAYQELNQAYPRRSEIPFDSERKWMLTVHGIQVPSAEDISPFTDDSRREWYAVAVKGAPDVVLNLCDRVAGIDDHPRALDEVARKNILAANETLTAQALRVLGVAYRLTSQAPSESELHGQEKGLVFVGLIGMIDPARPEVHPALEKARHAGIRTIMITGDYPHTARAIAENIGLLRQGHQVLTGHQLDQLSDEQLMEEVKRTDVFARVSPEHKMRIVDALRANGEIVSMTGDGVNDAPAIKRADIGVAMGITGTDVVKETADMVLTDDNYVSIVSAVEQGRIIYSNIRKFVYYLISCNLGEIMIIFLPTLFGKGSPLTAIQLLWLNLVTDGAPALALGTEKGEPDIMDQPPRDPKEPIINRSMQLGVVMQTVAITAATLAAFFLGADQPLPQPQTAETMAFVTLTISELFRAYTSRSERYLLFKIGLFSNKWMNLAAASSLVLILVVVYVPFLSGVFNTQPLTWAEWAEVIPLLLIPSIVAEVSKVIMNARRRRQEETQATI
jgi:P-type Ca2+ transporter type 2C